MNFVLLGRRWWGGREVTPLFILAHNLICRGNLLITPVPIPRRQGPIAYSHPGAKDPALCPPENTPGAISVVLLDRVRNVWRQYSSDLSLNSPLLSLGHFWFE
jgi:hypothetical protein